MRRSSSTWSVSPCRLPPPRDAVVPTCQGDVVADLLGVADDRKPSSRVSGECSLGHLGLLSWRGPKCQQPPSVLELDARGGHRNAHHRGGTDRHRLRTPERRCSLANLPDHLRRTDRVVPSRPNRDATEAERMDLPGDLGRRRALIPDRRGGVVCLRRLGDLTPPRAESPSAGLHGAGGDARQPAPGLVVVCPVHRLSARSVCAAAPSGQPRHHHRRAHQSRVADEVDPALSALGAAGTAPRAHREQAATPASAHW
jgi:hypothetical protein